MNNFIEQNTREHIASILESIKQLIICPDGDLSAVSAGLVDARLLVDRLAHRHSAARFPMIDMKGVDQ